MHKHCMLPHLHVMCSVPMPHALCPCGLCAPLRRSGYYEHSKLANVYFAYELQRRLGLRGVTSVAADPGGVRSNIWSASPMFSKGAYK